MRTYKYRLYPTKNQCEKLQWTLDRCREVYNAALQERKDAWKMCRVSVNYAMQSAQLPEIKEIREEYQGIYAQVLQDVLRRVDKTFKAFFRRVKNGEKPGFPRYKSYAVYDAFTYPQVSNCALRVENNKLALPKIGHIKIKQHRPIQGTIKTCTVKREGCHWYVCFACEVAVQTKRPFTDEAVGIDLGITHFAALSSGDFIESPRHFRKAEKRLAKAQQALARKKRGSQRRKKAVQRVAKCHRRVRNQRRDFHHQWSRRLVDTYETIVFEELAPTNLSKRPKPKQDENGKYLPNGASAKAGLNKSILDAGWGTFVEYVTYKAESAGVSVILVNPQYTSQICSGCGAVRKKDLDERWHLCECGCSLDRDHNAAINILRLGQSQQRQLCKT